MTSPLPPAVPRALTALVDLEAGGAATRVLHRTAGGSVSALALGAGQRIREHTTPYDALAVVTSGRGTITIAGELHDVTAGEIVRLPGGVPHAVDATDDLRRLLVLLRDAR